MTSPSLTLLRQIQVLDPVANSTMTNDVLLGSSLIQAIDPILIIFLQTLILWTEKA